MPFYAQPSDQPQRLTPAIRNLQELKRNNNTILRLKESNISGSETVPGIVTEFRPNQTYVIQPKDRNITKMNQAVYDNLDTELKRKYSPADIKLLPETYMQTGATGQHQILYRIGFESKLPLEYLFRSGQYEGSMKFFLFPESASADNTLKIHVPIEIVSNDIRTIDPASEEIDHFSIPLTEIKLQGNDLSDSAQVKIITKSNPEGYETYVNVRPAIELESKRTALQGFGVQKIPISVKVLGSSMKDSVKVSFNAGKGTVIPGAVYVRYDSPKVVSLRSEGIGMTSLTTSSAYNSNELEFTYTFPWMFILMAMIGGMIGALAKYFSKQEKQSFLNSLVMGILFGFMGSVVYYVLGIKLISLDVSDVFNEFAVLGFSALVAFLGIRVPANEGND